jgi:hypothetical protein
MEGKHVVVIGGGSYRMRNLWPDAEKYGIKVRVPVHSFLLLKNKRGIKKTHKLQFA